MNRGTLAVLLRSHDLDVDGDRNAVFVTALLARVPG